MIPERDALVSIILRAMLASNPKGKPFTVSVAQCRAAAIAVLAELNRGRDFQ